MSVAGQMGLIALRVLTIFVVPFQMLEVFCIDLWRDGLKDALWNVGCNMSDWAHWVLTGQDRWAI